MSRLHGRLESLAKRATEAGIARSEEYCPTCRWPSLGAPRFVVLRVDGDRAPSQCPTCARYVDESGCAVGGLGSTIVLEGLRLELG